MDLLKQTFKNLFGVSGYTIVKNPKTGHQTELPMQWEHLIDIYFSQKNTHDFFFIQIGAHDGKFADPLHTYIIKHSLRGIVIEPQPDVFKKLQETYKKSPNIVCVNAAIGSKELPFYVVKKEFRNEKNWNLMTGIASFDKTVTTKALRKRIPKGANPEDYIEEVKFPTLSLSELIKKYNVQKIDFLQTDCEGYDYEILKTLDFSRFKPDIINLESMHFSAETMKNCDELLTRNGYQFFRNGDNTCAYRAKR